MLIRDARPADAESVAALIGELGYPTTADEITRRSAHATEHGNGRILVAEVDGVVRGVATLYHIRHIHRTGGDICRITAFVITEALRGTGIGRALITAIEAHAAGSGCSRVEVTSATPRTGAHAFYRRLGYTEWPKRFIKDL
jgi:N-acetylglutamate synthase-like GNAT family acetyltransferase